MKKKIIKRVVIIGARLLCEIVECNTRHRQKSIILDRKREAHEHK